MGFPAFVAPRLQGSSPADVQAWADQLTQAVETFLTTMMAPTAGPQLTSPSFTNPTTTGGTATNEALVNATLTNSTVAADPTAALGIASKQYVDNKAASSTPLMDGSATAGTGSTFARNDHVHPTDTSRPAIPTASAGAGQWRQLSPALSAAPVLPAGGTWAYAGFFYQGGTGMVSSNFYAGVAAGGSTIVAGSVGYYWIGFCWRVA